jgi:pimeloyl-ACP methyl ester carboxylesterase
MPETRYAEASDGTYVAYQVSGAGPVDLVLAIASGVPVQDHIEDRHCAEFIRSLSSFARVIRFDRHGIGMSDPIKGSNTLEQWADDALTVLDTADSKQAVFFGSDPAGAVLCMMFVASHPERATRLVLFGGAARFMWAPDYPWGWPEAELERRLDEVVHTRLTGENDLTIAGSPSVADDVEFQDWLLRGRRRGLSPSAWRAAFEAMWRSDLRPILDAITMPTLVLYRRNERLQYEAHARYLADHIRGSRLIELPGADSLPFVGEVDAVIDEVREFVTGVRSDRVPDRVLATVLFSDIVDSTAQATALGDRH